MKTTTMILGTVAVLIAVALNFRHALDDYGIRNNSLHMEVLAQSNSVGGGNGSNVGGSNNSGSGMYFYTHLQGRPESCKLYVMKNRSGGITYSESKSGFELEYTGQTVSGMVETYTYEI